MAPTVAAIQLSIDDLDVEANLASVREHVARLDDVAIAVFPECTLTGFVTDDRIADVAIARDDEAVRSLRELAAEHEVALVVGFVEDGEASDGRATCDVGGDDTRSALYNATAYVDPDGDLVIYRKRHLWDRERDHLTAGDELVTVETPVGRAGLLTCYDLNFVGDSAALASESVEVLLVPAAWPVEYERNWTFLVRARALDGVRWVVGAARSGRGPAGATYAGRSIVARPDGTIASTLGRRAGVLVDDVDPEVLADQRELIGVFDDGHPDDPTDVR